MPESKHRSSVLYKAEHLALLVVVNGKKAGKNLKTLLETTTSYRITIVADETYEDVESLPEIFPDKDITIIEEQYHESLLNNIDLVIVMVDNPFLDEQIRKDAHGRGLPVNVSGITDLCDSNLVPDVKNGEERIIEYRSDGSFVHSKTQDIQKTAGKKFSGIKMDNEIHWRRIATWCIISFFFIFVVNLILSYFSITDIADFVKDRMQQLDRKFYWMIVAGFLAQLVDGMLGMGYGVVSTTILMSLGVNIAAISSSIHTAEMFSSGASGYTHYKFGNVNKKLFKTLLIPGVAGAVLGALLLSRFGVQNAAYIRPLIAGYMMLLGVRILIISFRKKKKKPKKVKRVGWLAGVGGFLDSFAGGGWGPLVTSTLISKGRSPRYVIGSVSITEFFVTFASALTFFTMIGVSHWQIIAGLIIGGLIAAPLAARLAGKLPTKIMLLTVGIMVIIWSLRILLLSAGLL